MTETDNDEISMAECGNCRAVIPSDSSECSECKIKFSGLSEDALGECGACGTLVPLESSSCKKCGVIFVADDVMDVLRKWLANTGLSISSLFEKFDTNGDGMIDSDELRQGLLSLNLADLPPSQIERLIEQIDVDGDGKIDLAELETSVTGAEYVPSADEKEDDSEVEAEEDSEEETEEDDSEEETEEEDSEVDVESALKQHNPAEILEMLINTMDEKEANPAEIFHVLDEDGDKYVSSEEFANTIGELLEDEEISQTSISDFIESLDADKDGNIDIIEFISAIESQEDEDLEKPPKEFPSAIQSSMMSKKWNDVWWPLIHAALFIFILAWIVNGYLGPVDGSGGSIELDSKYGMGFEGINEGEIYSCDSDVQADGCANSLTPFSGENGASSMPKGFYTDGIIFILIGAIAMGGSMFTHLVLAKGWRARVRAMKEVESDTEDAKEAADDEDEGDSDSDEEEKDDSVSDEEISEDEGDGDSGDEEDDSDEEEGDDSDEEDDIDIGSHIGLTVDEEEFFGTIIEFDDEDELVTIKEDGTGDEITGYQDEMFLE